MVQRLRGRVEFEGRRQMIVSIYLADGSSPAAEFLDALDSDDRSKMDTLFEMMGDLGEIRNREKFKKIDDTKSLFAFKSFQIRMPCFLGKNRRVYLLFGLIKKTDHYKPAEVKRAEEYEQWARSRLGE
jgi:hypothetical protein